jgi:general secretion pathway protein B
MSYIFDALQKVERERQRASPALLEDLLATNESPRVRPWLWLIVGALLVNAVVLAVLLPPRGAQVESGLAGPPDVPATSSPAVSTASPVQEERSSLGLPEVTGAPAKRPAGQDAALASPEVSFATGRNAPAREATPLQQEARQGSNRTGREQLLKTVARLKLTMLLYSKSAVQRLALINGRQYLEGQKIVDTILVEAITPTGVVLISEGERYLLRP